MHSRAFIALALVDMSFTTCTSRTRFIARVMLFVWLFSLAVGVANACVVQQGRFEAPMPGMAGVHDSRAPDASQQACKSFCDAEQSAVAKTKLPVLWEAPPMVVSTHAWRAFDVASVQSTWRIAAAAPPPGLPVAIRFLRLTL